MRVHLSLRPEIEYDSASVVVDADYPKHGFPNVFLTRG